MKMYFALKKRRLDLMGKRLGRIRRERKGLENRRKGMTTIVLGVNVS